MLLYPGQQFALYISCSPFRVVLAQCSCARYKGINPVLGISVFDTVLGLLILDILGNTQTGQFNLILDIRKDTFSRTGGSRLCNGMQ